MRFLMSAVACAAVMIAAPAFAQDAAPASAQAGDLTIDGGTMMAWNVVGVGLGGEVAFTVRNAGAEPDRVLSVSSPAGPSGDISVQVARDGKAVALEAGDVTLAAATDAGPGLSRVTVQLTDLASGRPMPEATTITVTFERAGEVTVSARPVSPAPPPAG